MSVYSVSVFLHIVGAVGLFAAVALEWAGLLGLRRSRTVPQVREWAGLLRAFRRVERPAALVILVTGLYLGITRWGHHAWIGLGLLGLVLIAALGALLTGRRAAAIDASVASGDGGVSAELRRRLTDPVLRLSASVRTSLALGIVFLMSVKPNPAGAVAVIGVSLLAGLAAGFSGWPGGRSVEAMDSRIGEQ